MHTSKATLVNHSINELLSTDSKTQPERAMSNSSSQTFSNVKKRNRISFVCQACRRSKTKCDREKPSCGRCAQHGIPCIYDVEKQPAPRNPSKDAKIARLERDLEYWKAKALRQYANQDYNLINSTKRPFADGNDNLQKIQKDMSGQKNIVTSEDEMINDIEINIYKSHPSMIMNRIMKREVKPLAENYAITQDKFLSGLIASVFLEGSKNTMIPALTANASVCKAQPSVRDSVLKIKEILIRQCHSEPQRNRINDFTERILQNTNSNNNLRLGMLPGSIQSAFDRLSIENFCPRDGEYSDLLKSFISEMETILPPIQVINKYKENFYEHVFPNLPFLNRQSFENSISNTLYPDERNPLKVKIRLGSSGLRSKMENLSILLVLLKLSYISLRFVEDTSQEYDFKVEKELLKEYPISNEFVVLAENCLLAENLYSCANENIITCLLYIWAFFVYSPEEGEFFLEHPTDVLTGLIVMLATSIGLHRDPSEFPQLANVAALEPDLRNHRRILWVNITTAVCIESCLKGRYPLSFEVSMKQFMDIQSPNVLNIYLERIKRDMVIQDPVTLKLHEKCIRQALLALLISDLDKMTLSYRTTFSLNSFENLRGKIKEYSELGEYYNNNKMKIVLEEPRNKQSTVFNTLGQHSCTTSKLILLRSSMAVFFHFEVCLSKNPDFSKYYKKYFVKVCVDALSLANSIVQIFKKDQGLSHSPASNYDITKAAQMALTSNFFGLLGMIVRLEMAVNMLFFKYHNNSTKLGAEELNECSKKMEYLSAFKKDLEIALEGIYNVASQNLRFTYYSVFKMLALFDVIIQRLRKGELWSGILILEHVNELNSNSVKALGMTLSLDLEGKISLIEQLKSKNYLGDFSAKDINEMYQGVRAATHFNTTFANKGTQTEGGNYSAPSAFSHSSLDNLDKLTSAATMSNNFDFQSNLSDQRQNSFNKPFIDGRTRYNATGNVITNQAPGVRLREGTDTTIGTKTEMGPDVSLDFTGLFEGLDLFDYDFLFTSDL